jgi:hypothetical protein
LEVYYFWKKHTIAKSSLSGSFIMIP